MKTFTPSSIQSFSIDDILELLNRELSGFDLIEECQITDDVAQSFVDGYCTHSHPAERKAFCVTTATKLVESRIYIDLDEYNDDIKKVLHILNTPQFRKHAVSTTDAATIRTIRSQLSTLLP